MLRVVLYAEGAGETAGESTLLPAPGEPLLEEFLGPAHLLLRRCLERSRGIDLRAIRFESPLRLDGRIARGSDLVRRKSLRRVLTWLDPHLRPDLAIVLVDSDEDRGRKQRLLEYTEGGAPARVGAVIAIAVEEFEAWLISDHDGLRRFFPGATGLPERPESLKSGEAKALLQQWIREAGLSGESARVRRDLASACDLNRVADRCRAFRDLLRDLEVTLPR